MLFYNNQDKYYRYMEIVKIVKKFRPINGLYHKRANHKNAIIK